MIEQEDLRCPISIWLLASTFLKLPIPMATEHHPTNQKHRYNIEGIRCISVKRREIKKNVPSWNSPVVFHGLFFLLQLLIFTFPIVSARDDVILTRVDYQALLAVKHELVDFEGVLGSWNGTGSDACSGGWVGIKCALGQVIALQLPWKGLGGRVSEKIGGLKALRRISLHDNVLAGPIPQSLGFLPNLRGVYLFNNRLSGSVPASFGHCTRLQTLDLSNNSLSGVIPLSLANSTKMFRLNLSFNSLSGSIPLSFSQSPSLIFLALQHNHLSGTLPNSWGIGRGKDLSKLQILTLDHNRISGTIPTSLRKLEKLEEISLSNNELNGMIPDELGQMLKLQKLDFSTNLINGSIPASLFNIPSLVSLNLEGNNLSDQIPVTINSSKNLSVLILRHNQLEGPIPEAMGEITGLTEVDLSGNRLYGKIPSSLSELSKLSAFNVSYNNLSGSVPSFPHKKFNSSSYMGNLHLCGFSISTPCHSPPPPPHLAAPFTASSDHHHHRDKLSTKDIILIAVGVLLAVVLLLFCILLCCLIRKKVASKSKTGVAGRGEKGVTPAAVNSKYESGGEAGGKLVHFDGPFVFTADDLLCATAEIMGKSNYGTAYKATLEDGHEVAVKRLREKIAKAQKEFEVEVAALGRIRHPNILALRAYYLGPKGEKLLAYDYMPKGSLASFLHARGPETPINWPTRMGIAMGVSRGLCYLHSEVNMIHGSLTSSNILLDEHTNAKIADVGLSRLMTAAANTNVVATAGALGYRAPELSNLKKASTKTDVYSLGVILLELLTGKSPGEQMNGVNLPEWVASTVKEEWTNEVFDLEIMKDGPNTGDELLNTLKLALHCVDPSPGARPEVQQILQQLEEIMPELAAKSSDDEAKLPVATE